MPDYEYVSKEMRHSGVTLNLLWLEYCEQFRNNGELPYQLTQFKKYYRDYAVKANATMHLNHKPGEILQVDWAGDTAKVINTDTGEPMPAYVFVACLPHSGYAYAEAFFSMNEECWITAHVNAFRYFGGITRIIQCDNLKTGVTSHRKGEVILNKAYNDMAEHYGTAILPCRVRAPKDKAMVEGTVGVISNFILAALRNRQFLSLSELNKAILERLYLFNNKPFQKRDGSRASEFGEERKFLLPLPKRSFELSEWKVATVAPNYHISVDRMNYSVPYEYIKQKVDVRLTKSTVEVFFNGNRICSHPRLHGRPNQYSTVETHMPANHQKYIQWNGERFRHWASKIGENTHTVIDALLSGYKIEQKGYKACMGKEDIERAVKVGIESLKNVILRLNNEIDIDNKDFVAELTKDFIEETKKKNCKLDAKFLDLFIKALKEKTDDEIKKNNKKLSSTERETLVIKKNNELLEGVWDDNKFEEYKKLMKKKFESKSRNPYSFASKFLHFHAPNTVFIKDTITHNNFSYGKDKDNKDFHFYFSCNEKASELVIKEREIMKYYDDKLGLKYRGDERLYALHCIKEYLLAKEIVTESDFRFKKELYIPRQLDTYMLIANSHLKKK